MINGRIIMAWSGEGQAPGSSGNKEGQRTKSLYGETEGWFMPSPLSHTCSPREKQQGWRIAQHLKLQMFKIINLWYEGGLGGAGSQLEVSDGLGGCGCCWEGICLR